MIALAARGLMRRARSASLATALASDDGWAYASLVTVACDCDGGPLLLLSDLAEHTRNLAGDNRASLLFEAASGRANPQTGPRVSVLGRIERSDVPRHRQRFLARHPSAALYAGFGDFSVYKMTVERAHYVAGFGRAHWVGADALLVGAGAAEDIAAGEPRILELMNTVRTGDATLYASRLLDRRGDGWVITAIDPDGCDLRRGNTLARLDFPRTAENTEDLQTVLDALADKARSAGS
jgi:putative heme iron utilization protein